MVKNSMRVLPICAGVVVALIVATLVLMLPPTDEAKAADGKGQFKGDCFWANTSYADPIVKPSLDMQHLHNFFGNKGVTNDSSLEQLMKQATTCDRPANKSAYWVPQVYIGGVALEPRRTGVYYS